MTLSRPKPGAQIQEGEMPDPSGFEVVTGGSEDQCDFCNNKAEYRCQGHTVTLDDEWSAKVREEDLRCISKVCRAHYHQFKSHGHNYQRI